MTRTSTPKIKEVITEAEYIGKTFLGTSDAEKGRKKDLESETVPGGRTD